MHHYKRFEKKYQIYFIFLLTFLNEAHIYETEQNSNFNQKGHAMEWITKQEAEEKGKGTELEAAKGSLAHWEQGRDCDYNEILSALNEDLFCTGWQLCSLCHKHGNTTTSAQFDACGECPLGPASCCKEHDKASKAFMDFHKDHSRANFKKFQEKAGLMCERLEKEIAKLDEKPSIRHGDYGYGDDVPCVICRQTGYDWAMVAKDVNGVDSGVCSPKGHLTSKWKGVGNVFDDMERNSEDLTEFYGEYPSGDKPLKIRLTGESRFEVEFVVDGKYFTTSARRATEIHQKLGQLLATNSRKSNEQK